MLIILRAAPGAPRDLWSACGGPDQRRVAAGQLPSALDECQAISGVLGQWQESQAHGELCFEDVPALVFFPYKEIMI